MDLEHELRALEIAWPEPPAFALVPPPRRRRRLALALAGVAVAACATALAVPQARGTILRFFDLGAVHVEIVQALPPAEQRALGADLGSRVDVAEAHAAVDRLIVPPLTPRPPLYATSGGVAQLFEYGGGPVLLEELPEPPLHAFVRKLISSGTSLDRVRVGADPGLWLSGRQHVVVFGEAPPRLAGNVLVWVHGNTTYRLEGRTLLRGTAVKLAESLRAD
jgi:hypothetical protein